MVVMAALLLRPGGGGGTATATGTGHENNRAGDPYFPLSPPFPLLSFLSILPLRAGRTMRSGETFGAGKALRARDRGQGFLHPPPHRVNDGDEGGSGTHALIEPIEPRVERGGGGLRLSGR